MHCLSNDGTLAQELSWPVPGIREYHDLDARIQEEFDWVVGVQEFDWNVDVQDYDWVAGVQLCDWVVNAQERGWVVEVQDYD